jgi:hypothetical protein
VEVFNVVLSLRHQVQILVLFLGVVNSVTLLNKPWPWAVPFARSRQLHQLAATCEAPGVASNLDGEAKERRFGIAFDSWKGSAHNASRALAVSGLT